MIPRARTALSLRLMSAPLSSSRTVSSLICTQWLIVLLFGRADTAQEMTSWMMMLGTQIKLYKPKPTVSPTPTPFW
jgi:hypothetical protein